MTPPLTPALLVRAYAQGIFPMGMDDGTIGWFSPDPRGILPLETFHVSARLQRTWRARRLASGPFEIRSDTAFEAVMRACGEDREDGSWISEDIIAAYCALHAHGLAHSVEVWQGERLVGGLYGVHLGAAFFGESMFHRETDASKVALVALVEHLCARGFLLLDIQWVTDHLARFGAVEIPAEEYLDRLGEALEGSASWE
jgi:leucyl/phenylalanyl-tRNA--protein transferase